MGGISGQVEDLGVDMSSGMDSSASNRSACVFVGGEETNGTYTMLL